MSNIEHIKNLRTTLRKQRRTLTCVALKQAEFKTAARLIRLAELNNAKKIGIYLDAFGEVPTQMLIRYLLKQGKEVFLPHILCMNQALGWKKVTLNHLNSHRLFIHHLGMRQIEKSRIRLTYHLDVIIMPLVAFDRFGNRVGMGGGFYDRTLKHVPQLPIRVGLAHEFQYITSKIPTQPWDQKLHLVCTPNKIWRF